MDSPLFQVALKLEQEACNLYTGLSGEARGAGGRRAFLFLARQEREHIARVETEIERRYVKREQLPAETGALATQYHAKLMAALQEVMQRTRAAVTEHTDQMRSLEIAAKLEDFLCCFYREAVSGAEGQHSKEFFQKMLQMERAHLDLLNGFIAHVEETGNLPTVDKLRQSNIAP
jgi:rubrerythrin